MENATDLSFKMVANFLNGDEL